MKKILFTLSFLVILAMGVTLYATPSTVSFEVKFLNLTNTTQSLSINIDTYESLGDNFSQPSNLTYNNIDYASGTNMSVSSMSSAIVSGQMDCDILAGDNEEDTSGVGISFGSLEFDFFTCYDDYGGPSSNWTNLETVDGLHEAGDRSGPIMRAVVNVNTTNPSEQCEGYVYKGADMDGGPSGSSSQSGCIYALIVLLPGSTSSSIASK